MRFRDLNKFMFIIRKSNWDLLIAVILTLLVFLLALIFPSSPLRVVPGLAVVLFFPGYIVTSLLFPGKSRIGGSTRIALSVGLSIAVMVFIGLALGYTIGIDLSKLLVTSTLFIVAGSIFAAFTRGKIKSEELFTVELRIPIGYSRAGRQVKAIIIGLVCVIVVTGSLMTYFMSRPVLQKPFTEFYILGSGGIAADYPSILQQGEEGKVVIGIVNHEQAARDYRVDVISHGRSLIEPLNISLKPGEACEQGVGFTLHNIEDNQKVEFLLYRGDASPDIRYIWVDVRS